MICALVCGGGLVVGACLGVLVAGLAMAARLPRAEIEEWRE